MEVAAPGRRARTALLLGVWLLACNPPAAVDEGAGGAPGSGGASASSGGGGGSAAGTGGAAGAGTGGAGPAGGAGGGSSGRAGSGGAGGSGGVADAGAGGTAGAGGAPACKRGIASEVAPGAAFSAGVSWWYNWRVRGTPAAGIELVPMIWGSSSLNSTLPASFRYLLGFNEPNFHAQANLTPQQAAGLWPTVQSRARAAGALTVGPGMNFCGPASACNVVNPYQYLKEFFAACPGCQVDHIAVHWYNCDLPSLRDYLEPGGNLEGFEQFGKPIWITEISCDPGASVAAQEAYMRVAIPYLESNPRIFRYSWFSADPIPNARLMNADGSPTALGRVYIDLPQTCR